MPLQKIIIVGPAYPLRGGGIATFNERLAKEFVNEGYETTIYTFSYQYPSFLFPGSTQYSTERPPEDITIKVRINSIAPLNWLRVGNELKRLRPEILVVRYWLPFMGPCLGTILRRVKKNRYTRIVCIADNVLPHEKRPGDRLFTRYFIKPVDRFITMSEKVRSDLRLFTTDKPVQLVQHPLYDNFGTRVSRSEARQRLHIPENDNVLLFFGFIRKYKGLDLLLEAVKILCEHRIVPRLKLLIAGEFYDDRKIYESLLDDPLIRDALLLHTHFIRDSDVKYYLCAADCVVQPYRSATQSGVTPLAYHFEVPMIVTAVGGLPSMVPDGKAGLVAEPTAQSLAEKITEYFTKGENFFLLGLREEKKKYSWEGMVKAILNQ